MSSICLAARTNSDWFADSGATVHMCSQRWMFKTFVAIKPGSQSIGGIKGVNVKVLGEGSIDFVTQLNGVNHLSTFQHVLFAPDLGINLFSIAAVTNHGWEVHFIRSEVLFFCNQVNIMVMVVVLVSLFIILTSQCLGKMKM